MANKERLSEFNRGNILTAANQLFREKGIAGTTVDDIAKTADYSKSTIYIYFKSKDDILSHIILEHIKMLRNIISGALEKSPAFPDGYYAICNALAEFYETNPLYFESVIGEIALPKNESETVLVQIYNVGEEINDTIEGYLKTWITARQIALTIPPLQAAFTLWAGISGVILLAHKKAVYISASMGVTKEEFMCDGFDLLLKSVAGGKA